ncbi:hypothetical protein GUITHDRAFT_119655 [Guillardia theta CCMP2712]|uniref:glycine hydroxymethyltransferase n=1 Tax=Guillardia theta (strain CCMP2712) TaxID=905079 RepID=L1ID31_GUITC|nr:hypothetical protein GUITHDRAFT_119655 [Guillardia theta CCMP2712]EKX34161.1 hypothetical protein GUITHDRAFT_119655 [Guillardia theta CCMP2712]|eukprot:XP_005821141.1 hypothetical protein GUITHDRAFT_119655 [Guillardia theta CCMP2712]
MGGFSLAGLKALKGQQQAGRLRGGHRPWRDIRLEEGETGFFYRTTQRDDPLIVQGSDLQAAGELLGDDGLKDEEYPPVGFFHAGLAEADPDVFACVQKERERQSDKLQMIASENVVSQAVLEAQGSVLTNKYAEGYPGKRYYGGCEHVDGVETLAQQRAKELFQCCWANVQPHSGAQANQAVMLALLEPGDVVLGMSLAAGGHLTHGAGPNLSGKWFKAVQYGVREDTNLIDYQEVEQLAKTHKPKLIIAGGSAYARIIDFKRFREIADAVGAVLLVDMAHFAGLVAGGSYPSPFPHAHVVTSTTHKVLRGPRGGLILSNDEELGKKINSAVFPGLQGGPLMHVIAAKAVSFREALKPSFRQYAHAVVRNAKTLAKELEEGGLKMVSGGTDSHLILVDLRPKGLTGKVAEASLERAGITCNKNAIPFDPEKPFVTSGIRLGTPTLTSRGMGSQEMSLVGQLIVRVLDGLAANGPEGNKDVEEEVREHVKLLCQRFPVYPM